MQERKKDQGHFRITDLYVKNFPFQRSHVVNDKAWALRNTHPMHGLNRCEHFPHRDLQGL